MLRRHELLAAAGAGGAAGGWNPGLFPGPAQDPDVAACYLFQPGGIALDLTGNGNDLTNYGVAECTSLAENLGCADFEFDDSDYFERLDGSLSANFPFKDGTSNNKISVCVWIKRKEYHVLDAIFSKYVSGVSGIALYYADNGELRIGLRNGSTFHYYTHASVTDNGVLYFVVFTYDNDTKDYRLHVYDCDADAILGVDLTGTDTIDVPANNHPLYLGKRDSRLLDAQMGGVVVARKVFTPEEYNQIRQGLYGT